MKLKKRMIMTGMVMALLLSAMPVHAGRKYFTNFHYQTVPYSESWKYITGMAKEDNDRNWYVATTAASGLSSSQDRAYYQSSTRNDAIMTQSAPLPIRGDGRTYSQKYYASTSAVRGMVFNLYIHGNENLGQSYSITVSGRYTS